MPKIKNGYLILALLIALSPGCVVTGHPVAPAALGHASSTAALEAVVAKPGPVQVETLVAADWAVPRSGLINLDHPRAVEAGLDDDLEPVHVYLHALRHPTRGLFLVDSGVESALSNAPDRAAIRGFVASAAGVGTMVVRTSTREFLAREAEAPAGVFLTHLHLDHVLGLPDVPGTTPVYVGPGEARAKGLLNGFTRNTTDRALRGHGPLNVWGFRPDPTNTFAGVLDIFGDGTVWALHVPGHTKGSTAYLARTPRGPVLLVGDACHTNWGWQHHVEPGTFSSDVPRSAESLRSLQAFVRRNPSVSVRLGHQAHRPTLAAR